LAAERGVTGTLAQKKIFFCVLLHSLPDPYGQHDKSTCKSDFRSVFTFLVYLQLYDEKKLRGKRLVRLFFFRFGRVEGMSAPTLEAIK
jgi:hypothetical protein